MHFDWGAVATVVVFGLGLFWANHIDVRNRHRQNVEQWERLQYDLGEYGFHEHMEQSGQLTVAGIRRPKEKQSAKG